MNSMTGARVSIAGTDKRASSSWVHPALCPTNIEGFSLNALVENWLLISTNKYLEQRVSKCGPRIIVIYLPHVSFTIHFVNMTKSIQPTYSDKSKYLNTCINFSLYCVLQFSFSIISTDILSKTFLSKAAKHSAISLFKFLDTAVYVVASGLVNAV